MLLKFKYKKQGFIERFKLGWNYQIPEPELRKYVELSNINWKHNVYS